MRIAIYFPSQSDDKIPKAKFQIVREMVERELIEMFGGLTEYKAKGFWKSKERQKGFWKRRQIIQEDVTILEAYGKDCPREKLYSIVEKIETTLKQQSVAYSIDNVLHFSHDGYECKYHGLPPKSVLVTVGITERFDVDFSTVEKIKCQQ